MKRDLKLSILGVLCLCTMAGCVTVPERPAFLGGASKPVSAEAAGEIAPAAPRQWADSAQDVSAHRADGWGLVSMPRMESYLRALHQKLKTMSGQPNWPGSVYVLADPSFKASSSAAGNIYISIGWLRSIASEDELFALLSHEFGHVYLNHHVVYEVKDVGDTASRLAAVGWMVANRNAQATSGTNGVYVINGLRELANGTLITAWQRSIEEEADRFGAVMSLRAGYSYSQGFKTFLERIETFESGERDRAEAQRKALVEQQRTALINETTKRVTKEQGGVVSPLGEGVLDLQVNMSTAVLDFRNELSTTISAAVARAKETHDAAAEREEVLSKAVEPLLEGRARSPAKVKPWTDAVRDPPTAEKLEHYALLSSVSTALGEARVKDAQKLAQDAASGASALDAMPLYYLSLANDLAKMRPDGLEVLRRHLKAPERSWKLSLLLARRMATSNRTAATGMLEEQFAYLGKVPAIWPDLIAFYRDFGQVEKAKNLSGTCVLQFAAYRDACIANATTERERKVQEAASERKTKELVDKSFKRIGIAPR